MQIICYHHHLSPVSQAYHGKQEDISVSLQGGQSVSKETTARNDFYI